MVSQDVFLTEDGRQRAQAQLEFLRTVKRAEVAQYLQATLDEGDVIDNAAYDDARAAQSRLEARIQELEQMLESARTITHGPDQKISLGSVVRVRTNENREYQYTLVGAYEARPAEGLISNESPVGQALLGHQAGDVVTIATPGGVKVYTILTAA